jgi:hypothetical protein
MVTDGEELKEYGELINTDPLELAEFLEQAFTRPIFRARLAKIFRNASSQMTDCHRLLSNLPARGIVTLNYDNGHEVAHAAKGHNPNPGKAQDNATIARWLQGDVFHDLQIPILHFHGDVSAPELMVLTGGDYDSFYAQDLPNQLMRQLWTSHRLLVVGFGFTDPFLTRLADRTLRQFPADTRHYAFIGRKEGSSITSIQRKMFAKKYRLTPVFYEVRTDKEGNQNHSDLKLLLAQLQFEANIEPIKVETAPVIRAVNSNSNHALEVVAERDFKGDLFVAPNGKTLYAEPRFIAADISVSFEHADYTSIEDILQNDSSYVISCRPEYGATSIARRLVLEFAGRAKRALLKDANNLPNYKKKLEEVFFGPTHDGILILDNFDAASHERLLKEVLGLKEFSRIIILLRQSLFEAGSATFSNQYNVPFVCLSLMNLSRADIRTITTQYFDTSDGDTLSAIVEKIYVDLVSLCIPIVPANVVMYLTVLCKDDDFQPINRVQIVQRYLSELLIGPADAYRETFTAKNKMDVISAFVFDHFNQSKSTFSESDWYSFCRNHMRETLTDFDDRALLQLLRSNRVLVLVGNQLYFKYRFFYIYFLGRYISGRPSILNESIESNNYIKHKALVEVLAELASDNEPLVIDITAKLNQALKEFDEKYIPDTFDPFVELEWPTVNNEEEKVWQPLQRKLERGPRNASEIDQLKSSLFSESRASNQALIVQEFDRLERRLFTYHTALSEALSNSDNLSGAVKKEAVFTALRASFRVLQIGVVFSAAIAERPFFSWYGLTFINQMNDVESDKNKRATAVMFGLIRGVYERNSEELGSRKLGEVFKVLAESKDIGGFMQLLVFCCLIRTKPRGWFVSAREMIARMNRNEFYLRVFLDVAFEEFRNEVNTNAEREELKKIVAVIRIKRDLRKDNPGTKDLQKVLTQLEEKKAFAAKGGADGGTL